jgi:hypothetical protein
MAISFNGRLLSPAQAWSQNVPLTVLTTSQATQLETFGEVLLPGSRKAGIANFVDTQLAREVPLLMVRYFDWPGPLTEFYTGGLAALDAASTAAHGTAFADATPEQQHTLVGTLLGGDVPGWDGPPPPLVYMAIRSDAVDVMYGTVEGFERLDIPYMPHISPEEAW